MSGANKNEERIPTPPPVPIDSAWLDSLTSRIRSRPIPWEGYARADLVSQDELKMIRSVDAKDGKEVDKILQEKGEQYAILYLRLLSKLSRTDTLQQVLVLIADMLEANQDRIALFFKAAKSVNEMEKEVGQQTDKKQAWPWAPVVRLLDVNDDFVQIRAAHFLATLLVAPGSTASSAPSHVLPRLLSFLATSINGSSGSTPASAALQTEQSPSTFADGNGADIAIQLLEGLLKSRSFRRAVWDDEMKKQATVPQSASKDNKDDDDQEQQHAGQTPGLLRGLVYILQNAVVAPGGTQDRREQEDNGNKKPNNRDGQGENGNRQEQQQSSSGSGSGSGPSSSSSSSQQQQQRPPSSAVSAQLQYRVLLNFWLLSFSPSIASELNRKFSLVPLLVDALRGAVKEKVMRVCVATLANLLAKAPDANASSMLGSGLLPHVEHMAEKYRRIDSGGSAGATQSGGGDEEVCEDVEYLAKELRERWNGMSNFDAYLSELESGKLTWNNPAHELEDFWRENAQRMLEKTDKLTAGEQDGEQEEGKGGEDGDEGEGDDDNAALRRAPNTPLKRLLVLLSTSQDATTLAVACNDLGKIVQFTDVGGTADSASKQQQQQSQPGGGGEKKAAGGTGAGRKRINEYGGKVAIMRLMGGHDDAEVRYRALQTVGRLMSASWR